MPATRSVAVLVGSLRKNSLNRKMARAVIALAPELNMEIVEIGDLPLYNEDLENASPKPAAWLAFRDRIRPVDALLFVTPEYNRSIPGALKNALDVGSRPYGQSVFSGKPAGIITVSPGALGGFGVNHHLRQACVFLDVYPLAQPEMYVGGAASLFDEDGRIVNDTTRQLVERFAQALARWIETFKAR